MGKQIDFIADALMATPPEIRGFLWGGLVRALVSYEGDGAARVFEFDGVGKLTYRELIRRYKQVAVPDLGERGIRIQFHGSYAQCPECKRRFSVRVWWDHYSKMHAVRPGWLNREHWDIFLRSRYRLPPEWRN